MKIIDEPLPGLFLLQSFRHVDQRGEFVKTFNADAYLAMGLSFEPKEIVFSVSNRNVIRGMHFQTPPADHQKLVGCSAGAIVDVVVDLRSDSPTFRRHAAFDLSEENRHALLVPKGFAHGFLALEDRSVVSYATDTVHDPTRDSGIRWDSFNYRWPVEHPVISDKDLGLPPLIDYLSPF